MQSQFMMIDPNELVVEWAVNDAHVEDLMKQLEASGQMLSEVLVWLHDMRIIDGFHRTEAAKRLGWKQIPCKVWDCTEEEFWDARIVSAKKHHVVEENRLLSWMFESWKGSKWYVDEETFVDLQKGSEKMVPKAATMVKQLWEKVIKPSRRHKSDRFSFDLASNKFMAHYVTDDDEFGEWLKQKSQMWGMDAYHLVERLMEWTTPIIPHLSSQRMADDIAVQNDLTFEQRQIVLRAVDVDERLDRRAYDPTLQEKVEGWAKGEVAVKPVADIKPLPQYLKEMQEKEREEEKAQHVLEAEKKRQWAQTPAGKAQLAKERKHDWIVQLEGYIYRGHKSLEVFFLNSRDPEPEGFQMLVKHLNAIKLLITDMYPKSEVKSKANPIWLENIELRQKVAEQAERIASLERALGSAKVAKERLPDTMAVSSTHVEAQP